jgi:hypothetical protein
MRTRTWRCAVPAEKKYSDIEVMKNHLHELRRERAELVEHMVSSKIRHVEEMRKRDAVIDAIASAITNLENWA